MTTKESTQRARAVRADIQGLRAVAVLGVVIWHLDGHALPGGFTGVDVFFVISGYLMTRTLTKVPKLNGREMLAFWARRIRRILPAASVTIVVTLLLSWHFLPGIRAVTAATDSLWAGTYLINWLFAADSVDYLASLEAPSHLQHFWSLAVEEQFYLGWPLLLAVAGAAAARYGRRLWALRIAVATVVIVSLAWSIHYTAAAPAPAYFVTTTRLWELALGGVVALLPALAARIAAVAGAVGLVGIVTSLIWLPASAPFPGALALWPTAATALVIWAGHERSQSVVGWVLGARPIQWVGDISYSLYLWHWPVIVFANPFGRQTSLWSTATLVIVVVSLMLAALSWRFVERPLRRPVDPANRTSLGRAYRLGAVCLCLVLVVAGASRAAAPIVLGPTADSNPSPSSAAAPSTEPLGTGSNASPGFGAEAIDDSPAQLQDGLHTGQFVPAAADIAADLPFTYDAGCHAALAETEPTLCMAGSTDADAYTVFLVGDSHAAQWVGAWEQVAVEQNWTLVVSTKFSCAFTQAELAESRVDVPYVQCQEWNDQLLALLLNEQPDLVVTSNAPTPVWDGSRALRDGSADPAMAQGLVQSWQPLISAEIPVVVMRDTPSPGFAIEDCIAAHPTELDQCTFELEPAMVNAGTGQLAALEQVPQAIEIDLNSSICPSTQCLPVVGGVVVFRDRGHLTQTYATTLAPMLLAALTQAGLVH